MSCFQVLLQRGLPIFTLSKNQIDNTQSPSGCGNSNYFQYRKHYFLKSSFLFLLGLISFSGFGQSQQPTICGNDDSREAKCYQLSEPEVYNKSRAVLRLNIDGGDRYCTGWLVGTEGHVLTNNHCISNSTLASLTKVEIMAEGADCAEDCQQPEACEGITIVNGLEFVEGDYDFVGNIPLDYTLLKLPLEEEEIADIIDTYGYFSFRSTGPDIGEQIYMAHHVGGHGKRITFESDHPNDNGFPLVHAGVTDMQFHHYADSGTGSSGSPVIAYSDHLVVGLHHGADVGGCPKWATNITYLINALVCIPANMIAGQSASFCCDSNGNIDKEITSNYTAQDGEVFGNITIKNGGQLIIKENRNVFMRQDRSITIESGGLLTIEEDASIGRCHEAEYWREVVVESGGAINSEGSLLGLKEGIKGLANSIVNLETGEIRGLSSIGEPTTGVKVEGAAQLSIQNLTIRLYDLAVEAVNGQNYYNIRGLTTAAVNRGVELKNSPAFIRDCEIGVNGNTAIYISRSAGTFASNNTCYGDIYIERSPSCVAEGNTIGGEGENGTLWLISSQASALRFNTVYSDYIGIYIRQPDASCIDNDVILTPDGVAGILLGFGDGVQVKNNSVIAPAASRGISDIFGSNNEIHNNSIYGSKSGIRVFGSPNESIVDNIIDASNGEGVDVFNSPNLKFECNSITAAGKGIDIRTNSEGQDFWHNYFAAGTDLEINAVTAFNRIEAMNLLVG